LIIDKYIVVKTSRSFPHSWLITGFVTRLTRRVPLVEQELITLPVFSGVRVTRSLTLYICFVFRCLSIRLFLLKYFCNTTRVWRYQRGNQNPYIEEEQKTQWPKERGQMDKQRNTKHIYKVKDRLTRTPLKTGRVISSCSTSGTRRVNLVTNPVISHEWGKDREVFTTIYLTLVVLQKYFSKNSLSHNCFVYILSAICFNNYSLYNCYINSQRNKIKSAILE
jgi:hypothetical protein